MGRNWSPRPSLWCVMEDSLQHAGRHCNPKEFRQGCSVVWEQKFIRTSEQCFYLEKALQRVFEAFPKVPRWNKSTSCYYNVLHLYECSLDFWDAPVWGGSKVLLKQLLWNTIISMQSHFSCKILAMLKGKKKQFENFVAMAECLRQAYMIMMLWENILIAGSHQVCTQALFLCVCRCLLYSCLSLGCYFLIPGVFALSNTESAWNTAITLNHLLLPTVNNQAVKARVTFLFMYAVRSLTWKLTLSPTVLGFQVSNYNFWWLPGNTNDCGLIGARRNTAVSSWSKEWVCSVQKTFRYVLLMVWHGENRG